MSLALIVFKQIIVMLFLIILGIICFKTKLITQQGNRELSNLLLMIVNPLVVLVAYQRAFSMELLQGLLIVMAIATASFLITIPLARFLLSKRHPNYSVERFSAVYSNCGFFGIPLVFSVLGSEGVFYLTAYITVFNILAWTHGILLMKGSTGNRVSLYEIVRNLFNPTIMATVIGFILFVTSFTLPEQLASALTYMSSMNTPLAMLIAGITLAQADLKSMISDGRIYLICVLKLLVFPLIIALLLRFFALPDILSITVILACACPTATTGTMFALRFNQDSLYASKIFVMATLLSLVTIPLIAFVC